MSNEAAPFNYSPDYHDLVGLIYDAISHSKGFFPFIHRFTRVFNGDSACFGIYDLSTGSVVGAWAVNIADEALKFYAEHIADSDPLLKAALEADEEGNPSFVASNLDIENVDAIRSQTPIGEFMDLLHAHDAAGAIVYRDKSYVVFFAMQRSSNRPSFQKEELAEFNVFLPHMSRAARLYTKLSSLVDTAPPAERAVLQDLNRGILIVDASFRVVFRNAHAGTIIANTANIEINSQGLVSFSSGALARSVMVSLSNAIRASAEGREMPDTILSVPDIDRTITVTISPLLTSRIEPSEGDHDHKAGAIVGLYDWSIRPRIDPDILETVFNLTPCEAKVAAMLANGGTLSDIASKTYRTKETVKSHLKSVFRKTNTCRQAELVAILAASSELAQITPSCPHDMPARQPRKHI
ncbi:helix-turn-helix transcriptional regulator [Marinobacter sp. F4216]|uniref:helix-turn-helix transcriptional regulator n=1 Tax=Marinobacter sp. F4216 TaxID=2874281 RepID=UPI001CBE1BA3|nr:helix-turn-helix transcriptional regulator [Marinobacter sp. F4216]MBZ2168093.1 helix-turn-helix transcriptional regulator [Marinobacter sp. F4216]